MVTNLTQIKIKPMNREQIIISIDRLTRFKPTADKYFRVFKDIILNNLISPTLKKRDIEDLDTKILTNYAEQIINYSLEQMNTLDINDDFTINNTIYNYENSIFNLDDDTKNLLKNKISYKSILTLLNNDDLKKKNLLWLTCLYRNEKEQVKNRQTLGTHFPIQKIILTEGITEEILLPKFGKILEIDFDKYGFHVISAGGKNQVVKAFYQYAETLKIPIFVLLDNDAKENIEQIKPKVRTGDKLHLVQAGEFEDLLPLNLILKTLNSHLKNLSYVDFTDFNTEKSMVHNLEEIYKEKGLEDFKKADFAHLVSDNIKSKNDLSEEIIKIIQELIN